MELERVEEGAELEEELEVDKVVEEVVELLEVVDIIFFVLKGVIFSVFYQI